MTTKRRTHQLIAPNVTCSVYSDGSRYYEASCSKGGEKMHAGGIHVTPNGEVRVESVTTEAGMTLEETRALGLALFAMADCCERGITGGLEKA